MPENDATEKPLAVDLFCGRGGWTKGLLAAGFRVVGIDVEPQPAYPSAVRFVQADIRDVRGAEYAGAAVVVASPPCTGFSSLNQLREKQRASRPRSKDFELLAHGLRVIGEIAPQFWAIENVAGAVSWFEPIVGPPTARIRPFYLWGRFPGFLLPTSCPVKVKRGYAPAGWDPGSGTVNRQGRSAEYRKQQREAYESKARECGVARPAATHRSFRSGWNEKDAGVAAAVAEIPEALARPFAEACMDALRSEVPQNKP